MPEITKDMSLVEKLRWLEQMDKEIERLKEELLPTLCQYLKTELNKSDKIGDVYFDVEDGLVQFRFCYTTDYYQDYRSFPVSSFEVAVEEFKNAIIEREEARKAIEKAKKKEQAAARSREDAEDELREYKRLKAKFEK